MSRKQNCVQKNNRRRKRGLSRKKDFHRMVLSVGVEWNEIVGAKPFRVDHPESSYRQNI